MVLRFVSRANGAMMSKVDTSGRFISDSSIPLEPGDVVIDLESKYYLELPGLLAAEGAVWSASGVLLRKSMLAGLEAIPEIQRLAASIRGIGRDFAVFEEMHELPDPIVRAYRPVEKPCGRWGWVDVERAIVWGLGKRGHSVGAKFYDVLRGVHSSGFAALGPAADALEAAGVDEFELLLVLRNPRAPFIKGDDHGGDSEAGV